MRRSIVLAGVAVLALGGSAGCMHRVCYGTPPKRPPVSLVTDIRPGTYELELETTRGSQRGATTSGVLVLREVEASIRTEERLLFGWTDTDLHRVGAPLGSDPAPESRDPLSPGVVVERSSDGLVIKIGSESNRHTPGFVVLDGAGIGLWPDGSSGATIHGRWGPLGTMYSGCGYFSARWVAE